MIRKVFIITFSTLGWVDVFTRKGYCDLFLNSVRYSQKEKGLIVYSWCLMSNHVHMIVSAKHGNLSDILRDLKGFTSRQILRAIKNEAESRRECLPAGQAGMLKIFEAAGERNSNNKIYQFWQQDNHAMEIFSNSFSDQKLQYIHRNPVEAGLVENEEDYLYSSARDYSGKRGLLDIEYLE